MATARSFSDMLNEHLNYKVLEEEYIKRDFFLQRCERDEGWKGGTIPVPFKGSCASTITFGGLAAEDDIAEDDYVRGEITSAKEVWGILVQPDTATAASIKESFQLVRKRLARNRARYVRFDHQLQVPIYRKRK